MKFKIFLHIMLEKKDSRRNTEFPVVDQRKSEKMLYIFQKHQNLVFSIKQQRRSAKSRFEPIFLYFVILSYSFILLLAGEYFWTYFDTFSVVYRLVFNEF